ncbi:MAG: hypothetical protein ACRDBH_08830 [Bosea sp. (in: a-proteobacteria)]
MPLNFSRMSVDKLDGLNDRVLISARIGPAQAETLTKLGRLTSRSEVLRRAVAAYLGLTDDERERLIWNALPDVQLQLLALISLGKRVTAFGVNELELLAGAVAVVERIGRILDDLERKA